MFWNAFEWRMNMSYVCLRMPFSLDLWKSKHLGQLERPRQSHCKNMPSKSNNNNNNKIIFFQAVGKVKFRSTILQAASDMIFQVDQILQEHI